MSKLARDHRNADVVKIQIARKELRMSDADYYAMLQGQGGVGSSRELDHAGRQCVLAHLERCGWKAPKKQFTQADKIEYFWQRLAEVGAVNDPSATALMAFVGRTTGMGVAHLKFLPVRDASKVIEVLKAWLARTKKPAAAKPGAAVTAPR